MSRRRKSWAPPPGHQAFIPALPEGRTSWAPWPDHIGGSRPSCRRGCGQPAMEWNRCACGEVFALCSDHGQTGAARLEREAHARTCTAKGVLCLRPGPS